jgi:putative DeoR family transcriptional regulator (stage III sporulation protein D)
MLKRQYDYETIRSVALFMIENNCTLRQAEKKFKIPRSTLHSQLTKKLKEEDNETYEKVRKLLDKNKSERAVRGGAATRQKYFNMRVKK